MLDVYLTGVECPRRFLHILSAHCVVGCPGGGGSLANGLSVMGCPGSRGAWLQVLGASGWCLAVADCPCLDCSNSIHCQF